MNKKSKVLTLLLLFTTIFFLQITLNIDNSLAIQNDINYIFSNDNLYNSTNIVYDEDFNISNESIIYSANFSDSTHSFTGETGLTSTAIPFIDADNSGGSTEIIVEANKLGHNETIAFNDQDNGDRVNFFGELNDPPTNGTYEFWFLSTDVTYGFDFRMYDPDGGGIGVTLGIDNDDLNYYASASWHKIIDILDNTWYHVKVDFECGADSYLGLAPDTFFITINGFLYGAYPFYQPIIEFETFYSYGNVGDTGYSVYLDAIGYSWDIDYNIGDNILPTIFTTNNSQVDKWEFAIDSQDIMNPVGTDNPNGWSDYEGGGGDIVNIAGAGNDRHIYMYAGAYDIGIQKTSFQIDNAELYNITWSYTFFDATTSLVCLQSMKVYSNDSTLIVDIQVYLDNTPFEQKLKYYDGSSYIELETDIDWLSGYSYLDFNLFIDYYLDIAIFYFYNGTNYSNSYIINLIDNDKIGLGEIRFRQTDNGGSQHAPIKLDSIGAHVNGVSLSDELAWFSIDINSSWNIKNHNLLSIEHYGMGGNLSVSDGIYSVGVSDFIQLLDFMYDYNNYPYVYNLYTSYISNIADAYLICYKYNYFEDPYIGWLDTSGFEVSIININGVLLTENEKEYNLEYSYSIDYTNPESSYFYVPENSSKMYFTLTCTNSNLEYIQAEFNIDDEMSDDTLIQLDSDIWGTPFLFGIGILETHFSDSTYLEFDFSLGIGTNFIAPLNKRFSNFTILITDNDIDAASGNIMKGWIENISFKYYYNAGVSLLMEDLMGMLIPLIVILVPAFLLNAVINKSQKEEKEYNILVPMLLLMTIVGIATNMIPIWVSFGVIFSLIIYLFLHKERNDTGEDNI